MNYEAYLLGYNPVMHDEPIEKRVPNFWRDGYLDDGWSCANLGAKPGDEFFLLRQGGGVADGMKGIVGHGFITTPSYKREIGNQWDPWCVNVRFDALTADFEPPIIPFAHLRTLPRGQHWSPKKSGIGIRPETLSVLHEVWTVRYRDWKKVAPLAAVRASAPSAKNKTISNLGSRQSGTIERR